MPRSPARALVTFAVCAHIHGCGSESAPPALPEATFALDDGVTVAVAPSGALTLRVGPKIVFATSDAARLTARTYEESVQGLTGIWTFSRAAERSFTAGPLVAREVAGGGVRLVFGARDELAAATVTVRPLRPGASLVVFDARLEGAQARSLAVPLACDERATFFGFGEQYDTPDQRGHAFPLFVSEQGIGRNPDAAGVAIAGDLHTTYFPMPYFLDARGYGVLVRTPYRTLVDLCKTEPKTAWIEVESGAPLEVVVFHGPSPLDVVRQLGDEVGRPRKPPSWGLGTWIAASGGPPAVLARVDGLARAKIAADAVWVQDWTGERRNFDGGSGVQYRWAADVARYPDLAAMIAGLKGRGLRFLGYANPFVVRGLDHFDAMSEGGMLLRRADGAVYEHIAPNGAAATPDFTAPATYGYVRAQFRHMVEGLGMDGFMADFGEWAPLDARYANGADPRAEHNLFPLRWHEAWRDQLDRSRPDGDYVVFARSGFTGVHRAAQIYWVGDQEADFSAHDGLPTVLPAMLSLGISGVPFVTSDVAGFSGGPSTKELYMRWAELGAFSPVLRTHEGNHRERNWSYDRDPETLAHFAKMAAVHARLRPDLEALATEAAATGAPIVRHLVLEYPDDRASVATHDEYLLGRALLIAPVLAPRAVRRDVYFPPGAAWFHVWSGRRYEGGSRVPVDAPLGEPPVFSRDVDRPDLRAP